MLSAGAGASSDATAGPRATVEAAFHEARCLDVGREGLWAPCSGLDLLV